MADLYADEQFPLKATQHLRALAHDVLTVQDADKANQGIPDDEVLAFATQQERAIITLNRRDFIRLHEKSANHAGIIVCKDDLDKQKLAERIDRAIQAESSLEGKLVHVQKISGG
ncbi:MAG: DUF5615 family PIN-like protein [Leptolyngbya sp. RL_3_1]|nr:DUF5615 family PIN-like protein [Leptolyngbya sp. RL_3_1]